jgi:hypothetical protein
VKASTFVLLVSVVMPAVASAQAYVVGQVGYAQAEIPLGAPYNGVVDDGAPLIGIDVGLGLGEKWAGEVGFTTYGSLDGQATPCAPGAVCDPTSTAITGNDQSIVDIAVVRRFTIGNVRLFGKAGYYRAKVKTNIALPDADFTPDGALLGIGARWYFDSPWHVTLEAERFDDNVSQISVGVGWGLGGSDRGETRDRGASEVAP